MGLYRYVTNGAVVEFFTSCSRRERDDLLKYFNLVANDPFQRGDYVQTILAARSKSNALGKGRSHIGRTTRFWRFGLWTSSVFSD